MGMLLHIFAKLWYRLWRVIWYPLALVWRRVFGIAVLAGFGYIVSLFFQADEPDQAIPAAPYVAAPAYPGGAPAAKGKAAPPVAPPPVGEIQPVLRFQNGNSAFADDLLPAMKTEELRYYSGMFYYVMANITAGESHRWSFGNIHGTVTPKQRFTNKRGKICRPFSEILKVHQTQQKITGISCQQDGGGWCKLRNESTPACDLGRKGGFDDWWFDTKQGVLGVFR